jgi:hypothetical protein
VGLDFEMDRTERLHDGYTILYIHMHVNIAYHIVWLHMKCKTVAKSFTGQRLPRFGEGKMRSKCHSGHAYYGDMLKERPVFAGYFGGACPHNS